MNDITFVFHDVLLPRLDPPDVAATIRIPQMSGADLRRELTKIEATLPDGPVILMCSVNCALIVRREYPRLARGLLFEPDLLRWHRYAGLIPDGDMLNNTAILLPFGALPDRMEQIESLFGERIFIRPDSALKPFPGVPLRTPELPAEMSGIRQVDHVHDDELVVIDRHRDLSDEEYRFWLVESRIVTRAGYRLSGKHAEAPAAPDALEELASRLAQRLEAYDNALVADLVMTDEGARLVELNALSTSGLYPGVFVDAIVGAAGDLFAV